MTTAKNIRGLPSLSDARSDRAKRTHSEAMAIIDQERADTRKKNIKLREARLTKAAEDAKIVVPPKPKAKRAAKPKASA